MAIRIASRDQTLLRLFDESSTEITERATNRITTRTRYKALGREGVAVFHFTFRPDGPIEFEKVCDGNVWRELRGRVSFAKRAGATRVTIDMQGCTKAFVPEMAIRGPMNEQIEQMSGALRACIEDGEDG